MSKGACTADEEVREFEVEGATMVREQEERGTMQVSVERDSKGAPATPAKGGSRWLGNVCERLPQMTVLH